MTSTLYRYLGRTPRWMLLVGVLLICLVLWRARWIANGGPETWAKAHGSEYERIASMVASAMDRRPRQRECVWVRFI